MMRVLVTGGTGFVGKAVISELVSQGFEVHVLTRDISKNSLSNVTIIQGNITDFHSVDQAVKNIDAVIHLVGIIKEKYPNQTYERIHIEGTQNIVNAMRTQGVKRLMHISALGAERNGSTKYFRSKYEAEEIVKSSDLDFTILRPSLIWDENDGFAKELRTITGFPLVSPIIGRGKSKFMPVKREDVAKIFAQSIQNIHTFRKSFDLVGPGTYEFEELIFNFEKGMNLHKQHIHIPEVLVKPFIMFAEKLHVPTPVSSEQLQMLSEGSFSNDKRIYQVLGFTPEAIF